MAVDTVLVRTPREYDHLARLGDVAELRKIKAMLHKTLVDEHAGKYGQERAATSLVDVDIALKQARKVQKIVPAKVKEAKKVMRAATEREQKARRASFDREDKIRDRQRKVLGDFEKRNHRRLEKILAEEEAKALGVEVVVAKRHTEDTSPEVAEQPVAPSSRPQRGALLNDAFRRGRRQ